MALTPDELNERALHLVNFNCVGDVPFLLDRFDKTFGFDSRYYGVPENRFDYILGTEDPARIFSINPVSLKSLEKFIGILKTLWGKHVLGVLIGGTRVDRKARSGRAASPHSIYYGGDRSKLWCTGIDIDGIIWVSKDGTPTIFVANRSMAPREHEFHAAYSCGHTLLSDILRLGGRINIEPAHNMPYVVVGCALSQCFGTVLHDKCGGRTGIIHRDHFHVDNVRKVGLRRDSNSQGAMIQMALNLHSYCQLKVDGEIGPLTMEAWRKWAERNEVIWTYENEMFKKLIEIAPIKYGQIPR